MSSLGTNWLKLNKLLDQYHKENRDITLTINYNIKWDNILLDAFQSSNNTAIHYAAICLPKILAFPSALVIFSSLEKSSILLQSLLQLEVINGNAVSDEIKNCTNKLCLHYIQLQNNIPNIRRVCGVFCDNLLEISIQVLDKYTGVFEIMGSALFHTGLAEDYTNLFRNKIRKTDHIQKLFSNLAEIGEAENIQKLQYFHKYLPIIFREFLSAFPEVQTNCKQFPISALKQFILGLQLNSPTYKTLPLITSRFECLSIIIEQLESHLRVFPNDPELESAEFYTFSDILNKLIPLYTVYPKYTSLCITNIQKINHKIVEVKLQEIFVNIFSTDVYEMKLLDSLFEIYSRLNQLDKLIQIIIAAANELDQALLRPMVEIKKITQKYFAINSLNTSNKCLEILLTDIENNPFVILSSLFCHILAVSPIRDLNTTQTHKNTFLEIINRLHSLLNTYTPSSLPGVFCYFNLLDAFVLVSLQLGMLSFSKDSISSLKVLEIVQINWFIIPIVWSSEWRNIASKFSEEMLKRIEILQMNILITLSRYHEANIFNIPPDNVIENLSLAIEQILTHKNENEILVTILQYSWQYLHKLSPQALLAISERILDSLATDNTLRNVLYSPQFKELPLLHSYICYGCMIRVFQRINTNTLLIGLIIEFYTNLIQCRENDFHTIIREINSILTSHTKNRRNIDSQIERDLLCPLDIIPLNQISVQLKLCLFLGLEVLIISVADREIIEITLEYCVRLLHGVNGKMLKYERNQVEEYICNLDQFTIYTYNISRDNKISCLELFTEIAIFLSDRNIEQFVSLTNYTITLWSADILEIPLQQYELTYAIVNKPRFLREKMRNAINNLVEVTTPILLNIITRTHGCTGNALRSISVNLSYIILSKKQESTQLLIEAIELILRQIVKLLLKHNVNDSSSLEALSSIANTLRQHNYSVDIDIDKFLNKQSMDESGAVSMKFMVGWIACSDLHNFRTFLDEMVDKIEFMIFCRLLSGLIEGNIPDTHRGEIRKSFHRILTKLTDYLTDREINRNDAFICLSLLSGIFTLPNHIGLSNRSVVQGITSLTLLPLDKFEETPNNIFQFKCKSLHNLLHNYPESTISCIPVFLLLTKELVKFVFKLDNIEISILPRLLESYTSIPALSNYTYHVLHQYIVTAQEYPQKQTIKKLLTPCILALIGFSKPETLLSLQAQLDTAGRSYYKQLREEFEKFYKFKGRT
ncbi:hypothetical protein LOD99_16086 [Oopsacas minuta]|uniref:Nucleolar 27S pre-rRNA processing Urb2/Npa2 C-terminal domain-containing protein n=1 Tax=Oopsacas minuta TaxID=111878 RepID=A0AAV7K7P3_9METZ|nr:hypothetical protein LOD99_16086 [Oopsacas minuta]